MTTKEHPILFSAPMIVAILAGVKTQTRRVIKPQPDITSHGWAYRHNAEKSTSHDKQYDPMRCPYGFNQDQLWVRETFASDGEYTIYRADNADSESRWTPSIFMPRWASRITLEIESIRAERLQEISEEDAIAEGVPTLPAPQWYPTWKQTYQHLWDEINGRRTGCAWADSPWVWVLTFRRL